MKDEWLRVALTDDTLVAELLFRLKQSSSDASTPVMLSKPPPPPTLPSWGQRLPRSKPSNSLRRDSTTTTTATAAAATATASRCSPTTPLYWSDGGYDDSSGSRSISDPSSASRSKGYMCLSEATNASSINKKSKKKRSFAELKEEENILLKERIHLDRELASLHVTLKQQRARSENLKRIKFDLNLQSSETGAASSEAEAVVPERCHRVELCNVNGAQSVLSRHATEDKHAMSNSCRMEKVETSKRNCFVLPDLNMTPTEEEITTEVL